MVRVHADDELRLPGEEPVDVDDAPGAAHRVVLALCIALPFAIVLLGIVLEPDPRGYGTHEQLGFAACGVLERHGVPCPGCGVTTAVVLAARGEVLRALHVQPLGLLIVAGSFALAAWAFATHRRGRDLALVFANLRWGRWIVGGLVAVLGAWAVRWAVH